jgi:hypothetical protein
MVIFVRRRTLNVISRLPSTGEINAISNIISTSKISYVSPVNMYIYIFFNARKFVILQSRLSVPSFISTLPAKADTFTPHPNTAYVRNTSYVVRKNPEKGILFQQNISSLFSAQFRPLLVSVSLISNYLLCLSFTFSNYNLKTKRRPLYIKNQSVPRCKHFISAIKTNQFML